MNTNTMPCPGACDCHVHVYDDGAPARRQCHLQAAARAVVGLPAGAARARPVARGAGAAHRVRPRQHGAARCVGAGRRRGARRRGGVGRCERRRTAAPACERRARRALHDAGRRRRRVAVGCAADAGRAHRAARLAHQPAARRSRPAAAPHDDRCAAVRRGDRPHRQVHRAGAGEPRGVPHAAVGARPTRSLDQAVGAVRNVEGRAAALRRRGAHWPRRCCARIPIGACGPATGRTPTACRCPPTRRCSRCSTPGPVATPRCASACWLPTRRRSTDSDAPAARSRARRSPATTSAPATRCRTGSPGPARRARRARRCESPAPARRDRGSSAARRHSPAAARRLAGRASSAAPRRRSARPRVRRPR